MHHRPALFQYGRRQKRWRCQVAESIRQRKSSHREAAAIRRDVLVEGTQTSVNSLPAPAIPERFPPFAYHNRLLCRVAKLDMASVVIRTGAIGLAILVLSCRRFLH